MKLTRPELRDIESLVGRLDNLVSGSSFVSNDGQFPIQIESVSTHHQKKATNLTSWLQSDYSIFDSQPQTTKVKKDTEPQENTTLDQLRMKRQSVSEKNILAALKSPPMNDNKRSTANLANNQVTAASAKVLPINSSQVVTGKKKEKKKDKAKKTIANTLAIGTFELKTKTTQGRETDRDLVPQSKHKRRSREGSLKFLTDRTQNIFGEKFSLAMSNALGGPVQSHRRHINMMLLRRDKSVSREKKKDG